LFLHGKWFIRSTQVNDFILSFWQFDTINQVGCQVGFANGIASRDFTVSKHDKRCTLLYHFQLSTHGFEKGRWSDYTVRHVALTGQFLFKLELGLLKLQPWILDTKGTE
jgi:hypothetical protein